MPLVITVTVISLRPAPSLLSLGFLSDNYRQFALNKHNIPPFSLVSGVSGEVFLG
jgi:hypothetical protein